MDLSDASEKIPSDTTGNRSRDLPTSYPRPSSLIFSQNSKHKHVSLRHTGLPIAMPCQETFAPSYMFINLRSRCAPTSYVHFYVYFKVFVTVFRCNQSWNVYTNFNCGHQNQISWKSVQQFFFTRHVRQDGHTREGEVKKLISAFLFRNLDLQPHSVANDFSQNKPVYKIQFLISTFRHSSNLNIRSTFFILALCQSHWNVVHSNRSQQRVKFRFWAEEFQTVNENILYFFLIIVVHRTDRSLLCHHSTVA